VATSQPATIWRRCSDTPDRLANHAAVSKATLVPLDHLAALETMARLVKMVLRVVLARMRAQATRWLQFPNSAHAKGAQARPVPADHLANLVNLEMQAVPETMALLALLGNQEDPAHKAHPVVLDPRDPREPLDSRPMEVPDRLDLPDLLAHKDPLDRTDNPVKLDLALRAHRAHKAHLDLLANLEAMADLDPLDQLEALVGLAPATTARHLDWPPDTKRCNDAGRGLVIALFVTYLAS